MLTLCPSVALVGLKNSILIYSLDVVELITLIKPTHSVSGTLFIFIFIKSVLSFETCSHIVDDVDDDFAAK